MTEEKANRRGFVKGLGQALIATNIGVLAIRGIWCDAIRPLVVDSVSKINTKLNDLAATLAQIEIPNKAELDSELRRYYTSCFIKSVNHDSSPIYASFGAPAGFGPFSDEPINEQSPNEINQAIKKKFGESVEPKFDELQKTVVTGSVMDNILNTIEAVAENSRAIALSRKMAFERSSRGFSEILDDYLKQVAAQAESAASSRAR